jgi:RimJ/RimL family protein N-acetyltransferase
MLSRRRCGPLAQVMRARPAREAGSRYPGAVPRQDLVRLRALDERDVDDIMTWVNDPEIIGNLAAFSGKPFTRADEVAYVRAMRASLGDVVFSVLAADDGRYLGQVGVHQIHARSRVGRLSCIIAARDQMGKGYGSAAIARMLDHAFGERELHKVWLMVFARNTRGRGIYGRLGFVEEGVLRDEYFHEGGWHDMVRMSILDREWEAG